MGQFDKGQHSRLLSENSCAVCKQTRLFGLLTRYLKYPVAQCAQLNVSTPADPNLFSPLAAYFHKLHP